MKHEAIANFFRNEKSFTVTILDSITNEKTLKISQEHLHEIVACLQDHFGIYHLTTITAQIQKDQEEDIQLYYHFWDGEGLTLLINISTDSPTVPSILDLIPGADFYEREVAEMFGISFADREKTLPLLLPDEWDAAPPMRKE